MRSNTSGSGAAPQAVRCPPKRGNKRIAPRTYQLWLVLDDDTERPLLPIDTVFSDRGVVSARGPGAYRATCEIIFEARRRGDPASNLWRMSLSGSGRTQLTTGPSWNPSWWIPSEPLPRRAVMGAIQWLRNAISPGEGAPLDARCHLLPVAESALVARDPEAGPWPGSNEQRQSGC